MINAQLAKAFGRIADLLEISGADRFRINSFRRASRTIKSTTEDIAKLAEFERLAELPGVGKGTVARIKQFLETSKIDLLTELEGQLPAGLPDLLDIPGMGPKKVALVHDSLNVCGMDDLKKAIENGTLAKLPGMGETSVAKIAEGIAFLASSGGRTPLGVVLPIAQSILEQVRKFEGVRRAEIAGSLRRGCETIGDVDILCDTDDGEGVVQQFTSLPTVKRILAAGKTKGSVTVELDRGRELQVDLRAVPAESFGAAWQYFTGSKEHNVRLRELALKRQWRLNEYGLHDGEQMIAGEREDDLYQKLDLKWVPPERREDVGEFGKEASFADLIELKDVRGDLHLHTVASDGKCSIDEMAEAAKTRGYSYIAICDHSKSSTIANGLSIERMQEHIKAIREANDRLASFTVLVGCECDILPDGAMDYPDEILSQCDWVVASIHSAMGKGGGKKLSPTERTLAAMENRYVCVIGHPTGRLINRRAPMEMDMAAVVSGAAATKTFLEINASWQRLDLKDRHVAFALDAGVSLSINTDAHHIEQLDQMMFGITTARRGGARRGDVVNTLEIAALRDRIQQKRG